MKVYLLKRIGKTWFGNMEHSHTVETNNGKFWAQLCFYRKKDAELYRKSMGEHYKYWEVVSADVQKSKTDNRKRL